MRTLEVREQFGHAKVFETKIAEDGSGLAHEACIATFDSKADADLFVALAKVTPTYTVEFAYQPDRWVHAGNGYTGIATAEGAIGKMDAMPEGFGHMSRRVVEVLAIKTPVAERPVKEEA